MKSRNKNKDLNQKNREFDMTIEKSYLDRITDIEKLLKKHGKIILNNESVLNKHIIAFNEFVKELRTNDIEIRQDLVDSNTRFDNVVVELKYGRDCNAEQIKLIHNKLDSILNLKVNGTTGLENVLRLVYENTKGTRLNKSVIVSIKNWFEYHNTLKLLIKSRIVLVIITLIVSSLLQVFGIDVYDFAKDIVKIIAGK